MPTPNTPQATVWQTNAEQRLGHEFRTPSGQLCLVRKADLQQLVFDGVIDDIDAVTKIVNSDIMKKSAPRAGTNKKADQAARINESLGFMKSDVGRSAIQLMDIILPHVIVAPVVLPNPESPSDRVAGVIYVSDIDINDRAAIFAEVMEDMEKAAKFRD